MSNSLGRMCLPIFYSSNILLPMEYLNPIYNVGLLTTLIFQ